MSRSPHAKSELRKITLWVRHRSHPSQYKALRYPSQWKRIKGISRFFGRLHSREGIGSRLNMSSGGGGGRTKITIAPTRNFQLTEWWLDPRGSTATSLCCCSDFQRLVGQSTSRHCFRLQTLYSIVDYAVGRNPPPGRRAFMDCLMILGMSECWLYGCRYGSRI